MIERAVRNKIHGLIAREWDSSDELALFKGHEKSGYYQRLELRIAFIRLGLEINKEILSLIKRVKRWTSK